MKTHHSSKVFTVKRFGICFRLRFPLFLFLPTGFLPCLALSPVSQSSKHESSIGTNEPDPNCWEEIPFPLICQQRYKEAIKELKALVEGRSSCKEAYHQLAYSYKRIHKNRRALQSALKALSFESSSHGEDLRLVAGVLADLGRYDESANYLSECIKEDGNPFPSSLSCRGTYYFYANKTELAINDLTAAIGLYKGDIDADAYYYRGQCFMRKHCFDEALRGFEKVNTKSAPVHRG